MKIKKFKYLSMGIVIGLLLSLTTYAFAADISAKMWKVGVFLNGVKQNETCNAIFSEGDIYLPAKYFSNVFGMSYSYSDKTGMLTLNDSGKQSPQPTPSQPTGTKESYPTSTTTKDTSRIVLGTIDPSIPVPDQTNAIRYVDLNDPNVVTELTLRSELPEGSKLKGEYDIADVIKYNGVLYYTIRGLDEYGIIDRWNNTPSLKTYGISYHKIWKEAEDPKIYIALYKGSSASIVGAILNQVYAHEDDIILYNSKGYIRFDLVKEMLEKVGLNSTI